MSTPVRWKLIPPDRRQDCGYPPRGPWRKRCRCLACQFKRAALNAHLRARANGE